MTYDDPSDASYLRGERKVRMPAGSELGKWLAEDGVTARRCGRNPREPSCLVQAEGPSERHESFRILELSERPRESTIERSIERASTHHRFESVGER